MKAGCCFWYDFGGLFIKEEKLERILKEYDFIFYAVSYVGGAANTFGVVIQRNSKEGEVLDDKIAALGFKESEKKENFAQFFSSGNTGELLEKVKKFFSRNGVEIFEIDLFEEESEDEE